MRRNTQPYEHRLVIERLMLEQTLMEAFEQLHYAATYRPAEEYARVAMEIIRNPPEIPPGIQIHHQNYDRADNRPANLLLLDAAIHSAITHAHRKFVRAWERDNMMAKLRGKAPCQNA
jgi:hypothetical protein